jgi:uncharacterized repeat protein (TIGR01451 family)
MTTTKNPNLRKKAYAAVTSLLLASASAVIYNPPAEALGTPEGTVISNQATATYKDAGNNAYTSTSNLVTTTVTAVYSFVLQPDSTNQGNETLAQNNPGQSQNSTAGNIVYFPYTLRNNSNATDDYELVMINGTASTVVPENVELYIDTNGNGFIDVGDSLIASGLGAVNDNGTGTPEDDTTLFTLNTGDVNNVDADGQVKLIVKYQVPVSAPNLGVISLDLRAKSKLSGASALVDNDAQDASNLIDSRNYNRVNVVNDAVIAVTKAVDKATANPGEEVEYTFTISNTGNKDARNIRLIDTIPKDIANGRITDFVVGTTQSTEGTFSYDSFTDTDTFNYNPLLGEDGTDVDGVITASAVAGALPPFLQATDVPGTNGANPYVTKIRYDLPLLAPGNTRTIKFKVKIRSVLDQARAGLVPNNAPYDYDTAATYTGVGDTTPDVPGNTNTVNTEINRKAAALISTALSDPASPAKAFVPQTVSSDVYASTNPYALVDVSSILGYIPGDGVSDGDTSVTDATTQDTAPANSYVYYKQVVTNRGNASDTFNITTASNTFPSGSSVTYYQLTDNTVPSNNTSPLLDTNGDSLIDTGAIAVGASKTIVARVFIPSTANAGGTATVRATSTNGGTAVSTGAGYTLEDTTRDIVTTVQVPSVNLENYIDVNTARGYAQGEDLDTSVSANASANGTTVSYPVTVQNRGGSSDSFDLNASVSGTLSSVGATVAYYPIVSKTTVSVAAAAAATSVTLSNASGFVTGDKIVINGQSLTVANVAGNVITFSLGESLYEAASVGEVASEAGLSPITSTTPIAPTTPISTLTSAASATDTSITLASTTGLSVGDIIKVITADAVDGEEYFTIGSIAANVVTFAPGQTIANAAVSGAVVSRVPYQNVLAVVTVPVDTAPIAPNAQNVTLSTVSNNDPSRVDQVINDLVIPNFRDFTLVANRSGSAAAGTVLFYDHVLTNIGNSTGNFDFSIVTDGLNPNFIYQLLDSSNNTIAVSTNSAGTSPNQTFTYSTNSSVAVPPGAVNAHNFKVKVTIPAGTAAGTVDTITVRGFEEVGTATTLSANALSGDTSVTLSSVTGLVVGDLIRVTNNAGGKEYFTIGSIAGNVVNFASGQTLKSAASSGNSAIEVIEKNNTDITTVVAGFIQLTKTVRNVTAGTAANTANTAIPGDILEYVVDYSNVGSDTALDVVLTDLVPANTTYVSNSLAFDDDGTAGANAPVAKTDGINDESGLASANYEATAPSKVKFFLGTGQTGSTGGSVPSGGKGAIIFQVQVN